MTIEARFGESAPLSLGVEEELMILDAGTFLPAPAVERFVGDAPGGRLKTELHASIVELNTGVCATVDEAAAALAALRAHAGAIAQANGLVLAAAGAHPLARPEELAIVAEPRYLEMVELLGPAARRQGVSGLHVHVGMPSGDDCVRVLEWVLPWLPVILAISANSPYMGGAETGYLSTRAGILAELPRSGPPPALDSYADWEAFVDRCTRLGIVRDYTQFWWDIRPHPRLGTLEVRIPDQPTSLARSVAFVALIRGLCAVALEAPPRAADRALYAENRWWAARSGPLAMLAPLDGGDVVAARQLGAELLDLVGLDLETERCEADLQLAAGLDGVCADLVARTAEPSK